MSPKSRRVGRMARSPLPHHQRSAGERDVWLALLIWILDDMVLTTAELRGIVDRSSSVSALAEDEELYG